MKRLLTGAVLVVALAGATAPAYAGWCGFIYRCAGNCSLIGTC